MYNGKNDNDSSKLSLYNTVKEDYNPLYEQFHIEFESYDSYPQDDISSLTSNQLTDVYKLNQMKLNELKSNFNNSELFISFVDMTVKAMYKDLRQWLHNKVNNFMIDESKKLLWLQAGAGIGKTTFSCDLFDRLHKSNKLLGAYFFNFQEADNVVKVFKSLSYQIAICFPQLLDMILEKSKLLESRLSVDYLFNELILEPLMSISDSITTTMVIVIDALDETRVLNADDHIKGRKALLRTMINRFSKLPSFVKIFITSRPEQDIIEILDKCYKDNKIVVNEYDSNHIEDLRLYIRHLLELTSLKDSPIDLHTATETLLTKSGNKFVYISAIKEELDLLISNKGSIDLVLQYIEKLPTGLYGSYDRYFNQIINKLNNQVHIFTNGGLGYQMLQLLVSCRESLSDDDVKSLLSIGDDNIDLYNKLKELLHVVYPVINNRFTPFHKTIVDYLVDKDRVLKSYFYISRIKSNAFTTKCLLKYTTINNNIDIKSIDRSTLFTLLDDKISIEYFYKHALDHFDESNQNISLKLLFDIEWYFKVIRKKEPMSYLNDLISRVKNEKWHDAEIRGQLRVLLRLLKLIYTKFKYYNDIKRPLCEQIVERLKHIKLNEPNYVWLNIIYNKAIDYINQNNDNYSSIKLSGDLLLPDGVIESTLVGDSWVSKLVKLDDNHIIVGYYNGILRIWDIESAVYECELQGPIDESVLSLYIIDNNHIMSAYSDNTIRLWDIEIKDCDKIYDNNIISDNTLSSILIINANEAASGFTNGKLVIWEIETGREIIRHRDLNNIISISKLSDGRLVSRSNDRTIRIWDNSDNYTQINELFIVNDSGIYVIHVLPDDRFVSSGSYKLSIWTKKSDKYYREIISLDDNDVLCISNLTNGHIVTGHRDGSIRIWMKESDTWNKWNYKYLKNNDSNYNYNPIYYILILDNDRIIYNNNSILQVYNISSISRDNISNSNNNNIASALCSNDNGNIISGYTDGSIRVWDSKSSSCINTSDREITALANINNNQIVSVSKDMICRIWNIDTGEIIKNVKINNNYISDILIPNNDYIVFISYNIIYIWDIKSNSNDCDQVNLNGRIYKYDNTRILIQNNTNNNKFSLFNVITREYDDYNNEYDSLLRYDDEVSAVAKLDNNRFVCVYDSGLLLIWDISLKSYSKLGETKSRVNRIYKLDKDHIVTILYNNISILDNNINIWNINTRECKSISNLLGYNMKSDIYLFPYILDADDYVNGIHIVYNNERASSIVFKSFKGVLLLSSIRLDNI